jgi:hypothetical protein
MKPGDLVRLVRNRDRYNTIVVVSASEGSDMANPDLAPLFTIFPDMVGMCIDPGGQWRSCKVLFGDQLVWAGKSIVEPLEESG